MSDLNELVEILQQEQQAPAPQPVPETPEILQNSAGQLVQLGDQPAQTKIDN